MTCGSVLDQELSRLPAKYRALIVSCDLEGMSRREAAQLFRLPEGTVASRLATARGLLSSRLKRAGIAVSAGAIGGVLASSSQGAAVPAALTAATSKAVSIVALGKAAAPGAVSLKAVALADRVVKTMLLTKLKFAATTVAALSLMGVGTVAIKNQIQAEPPAAVTVQPNRTVTGSVKGVDVAARSITIGERDADRTYTLPGGGGGSRLTASRAGLRSCPPDPM